MHDCPNSKPTPQSPPPAADSPEEIPLCENCKNAQNGKGGHYGQCYCHMLRRLKRKPPAAQAAEAPGSVDEFARGVREAGYQIMRSMENQEEARKAAAICEWFAGNVERAKRKPPEPQQGGEWKRGVDVFPEIAGKAHELPVKIVSDEEWEATKPQQGGQTDEKRAWNYLVKDHKWVATDDYYKKSPQKSMTYKAALWGLTEGRRLEREKHGK